MGAPFRWACHSVTRSRRLGETPLLGEPEEPGALEVAAMRPHALANQLDESEVFTSGDAEPAVVLGAREPNDGDDVATVALHTTARLPPGHLVVTAAS